MNTYLLTWNPAKSTWLNYDEEQKAVELGYIVSVKWSCGVRKHLPIGSRIFMMRLGYQQPKQGVFASGYATHEPELGKHWNNNAESLQTMYTRFELDVLLNLDVHNLLVPQDEVSDEFNWYPQSSGVEIPQAIATMLESEWVKHLADLKLASTFEMSVQTQRPIFEEGKHTRVTVSRYERDPKARKACIDAHGTNCCVCGFDFEAFYGEIGRDFIHVHHLNPIAAQGGVHEIDPIKDMRPVCPNCHAIIHRHSPPLSIQQLKDRIGR